MTDDEKDRRGIAYHIGERPALTAAGRQAVELLRGRSTADLGHWSSLGYAHGLTPLVRPAHAVGPVVTARASPFDASSAIYAVTLLTPGDVLVIDTGGERKRAAWGGGLCRAAHRAGAAGVIVDGPVVDSDEIVGVGLPTWARGTTSITYRARDRLMNEDGSAMAAEGGVNVPVAICDVVVSPGDVAFADSDGVFFLPPEEIVSHARRLAEVSVRAARRRSRTSAGEELDDLDGFKADYEAAAIRLTRTRE